MLWVLSFGGFGGLEGFGFGFRGFGWVLRDVPLWLVLVPELSGFFPGCLHTSRSAFLFGSLSILPYCVPGTLKWSTC